MNKKLIKSIITLGLALTITTPAFASTIGLNINNFEIKPTQSPVIEQGTTLVPLRVISENLGATVDWDAKDKKVTVVKDTDTIVLTIGSKQATVNGEAKTLPQAPKTINGTTMLPVRFVAENLDCQVQYDKGSNTVFVTSDGVTAEIPDTTGWKTTTIKNPKIINGVPYLTEAQMVKAFDVEIKNKTNTFAGIERQDLVVWLISASDLGKTYNRINWTYVPTPKTGCLVVQNGQHYFPVQYLAPYLNATVNYDINTKELTATYKGIKIHETIPSDQQFNTVKGYVYLPDGTPAEGFDVSGFYVAWDKGEPLQTTTDKNGYYEFKNIDVVKYPTFGIGVSGKNHTNSKYRIYGGSNSALLISKDQPSISDFNNAHCYSNLKQIPDITLVDESIWDK